MQRSGVGLVQAIMIILLVSGMMMIVLKYASISTKHTIDTYVYQQSELYLSSVVEQTLLAISAQDRSVKCLSSLDTSFTKRATEYKAHIDITKYYLLSGTQDAIDCGILTELIGSEETHGMVMLEVEVTATVDGEEKVRLLRRTLQRP